MYVPAAHESQESALDLLGLELDGRKPLCRC